MGIDAFDIPNMTLGTDTQEEHNFQICNFMNMLMHYIDNVTDESKRTRDIDNYSVVRHNLSYEIGCSEAIEPLTSANNWRPFKYNEYFAAIINMLMNIESSDSTEYREAVANLARRIWVKTYDDLRNRFVLLSKYTSIRNK